VLFDEVAQFIYVGLLLIGIEVEHEIGQDVFDDSNLLVGQSVVLVTVAPASDDLPAFFSIWVACVINGIAALMSFSVGDKVLGVLLDVVECEIDPEVGYVEFIE
jgi:hypothetical protein